MAMGKNDAHDGLGKSSYSYCGLACYLELYSSMNMVHSLKYIMEFIT
jgi:hypothetical protein